MPRDSKGTRAPPTTALLAASGDATPSSTPVPKSSGCVEARFSSLYAMKDATAFPAPGTMPMMKPMIVPRSMAICVLRYSRRVGRVPENLRIATCSSASVSMVRKTSETANSPTRTGMRGIPSYRPLKKMYRLFPLTASTPIVVIKRPNSTAMKPRTHDFPARPATVVSPKTPSAKYSGGPNFRAIWANGMDTRMSPMVLAIPA